MKQENNLPAGRQVNIFEKVYEIVRNIPKGSVMTYGDIAEVMKMQGYPISAQMVGFALHANSGTDNAPCHRVVNKEGRVAPGFAFGGATIQLQLLEQEGVTFVDDTHVDMVKHHKSKI